MPVVEFGRHWCATKQVVQVSYAGIEQNTTSRDELTEQNSCTHPKSLVVKLSRFRSHYQFVQIVVSVSPLIEYVYVCHFVQRCTL